MGNVPCPLKARHICIQNNFRQFFLTMSYYPFSAVFTCLGFVLSSEGLNEWTSSLLHLTMLQIFRNSYLFPLFFHHLLDIQKIINCHSEFYWSKTCWIQSPQTGTKCPEGTNQDSIELRITVVALEITTKKKFLLFFLTNLQKKVSIGLTNVLTLVVLFPLDFWLRFEFRKYIIKKYKEKGNQRWHQIFIFEKNKNHFSDSRAFYK